MAISAAASVDGRMKMCSSASCRLVRVRRGSTQTMRTPCFFASLRYCMRAGAERAVGRAPAPHQDQLGIDVVGRLAAGGLVVGLGAVGHAHGEHLGLGRHVRPQLGAAAEHVEEALAPTPRPCSIDGCRCARRRGSRRCRSVLADAQHLARRRVSIASSHEMRSNWPEPRGPDAAHRILQPVGMIDALDLTDAAGAGVQRRHAPAFQRALVGRDVDDAVVATCALTTQRPPQLWPQVRGDDGLAVAGGPARVLVDRVVRHGGSLDRFRPGGRPLKADQKNQTRSVSVPSPRSAVHALRQKRANTDSQPKVFPLGSCADC